MSTLEQKFESNVILIDRYSINEFIELRMIEQNGKDIFIQVWINSEPFKIKMGVLIIMVKFGFSEQYWVIKLDLMY